MESDLPLAHTKEIMSMAGLVEKRGDTSYEAEVFKNMKD